MAQRSSRKRRKGGRPAPPPPTVDATERSAEETPARGYSRSRERDAAARAALDPLRPGERPAAVTVGALVALFLGVANLASYLAGLEVGGERPAASGIAVYSGLMLLVAYGMWRARYWAVLGMEALLGLIIVIFALLATRSEGPLALAIAVAVIASAGSLFWFLVKAMARIRMPERPGAGSR